MCAAVEGKLIEKNELTFPKSRATKVLRILRLL